MASVSIRDLRNHGGEVIDRVEHGESIEITRDGRSVAEIRPLEPRRPSMLVILERFRHLPSVDPVQFRKDIDETIGTIL
jgi:prevent-host-death family protein